MASLTTISVDGEHGGSVARSSGIRIVDSDNNLALVSRDGSRDGRPGTNARRATPGAPAGFLAVDLSESTLVEEGITVRTLGFMSRQEPPHVLEVPARRNVLFSAVGGRAESGHTGGDGQKGANGGDGTPATREVDATPGTNGGDGGNFGFSAGQGSNGANGGDGGTIEISVDEDNLHLLLAVDLDVRGGEGGAPGFHGQPGQGGQGGNGGAGHKWRELVGYRFQCTSSCIGQGGSSTSSSLVRARSVVGTSTLALVAPMRAQAVEGGNLQASIAAAARWYGTRMHERKDPGSCRCMGGIGNCFGCESVPIHNDFQRIPGNDGRDGKPGQSIDVPVLPGLDGHSGNATFYVRHHDGSQQQYTTRYQLELVDFAVEEENGDGIFEPGEHLFIRRIRIRNAGGMPSPKCHIPISVIASKWFLPVSGEESHTVIPNPIAPGVTVTLEGFIKLLISRSDDLQPSGRQLLIRDRLSVRATMPWLNRDLPYFEWSHEVEIQYPATLQLFDVLPSLAQGSISQFNFDVLNKSQKALGIMSNSRRHIEANISFPEDSGALLSPQNTWRNEVARQVIDLRPNESIPIQQRLRIASNAQNHQRVTIRVELWIAVHLDETSTIDDKVHEDREVELQLIQQHESLVQISSHHTFNERSKFLIVTNSGVTRDHVQSIKTFICDELKMMVDEWNVSLYGGLQYPESAPPEYVMGRYQGKTIIFMGNKFDYFNLRNLDTCELCDPRALAEVCVQGTRCLFLEASSFQTFRDMVCGLVSPVPYRTNDSFKYEAESRKFQSRYDLVQSLSQQKIAGGSSTIAVYTLPIERRWYRFPSKDTLKTEAKSLSKFLRQQLPQERFLVTYINEKDTASSKDQLIVLHGVPHSFDLIAGEVQPRRSERSSLEAFMIANALSSWTKVDTAWSLAANTTPSSPFAFRAIILSLLLSISTEVHRFLHMGAWPNAIRFPNTGDTNRRQAILSFLCIHLPTLAHLLQHPAAEAPDPPPEHILEVVKYTLTSCRAQKKRHLVQTVIMPFRQRRIQLHRLLVSAIEDMLSHKVGNNKKFKAAFYAQVKALHSKRNKNGKRDTTKQILKAVSEFTKCSDHVFTQGQLSSGTVISSTESCTPEKWNQRWEATERNREKILAETRDAWDTLGRMIIEA
ncbi:MAG: hypothetical protein M1812_007180 [Candelaria pacifica]|nr:MAG: hypothetical protein M1812_007180 [Candelaria pacifica]